MAFITNSYNKKYNVLIPENYPTPSIAIKGVVSELFFNACGMLIHNTDRTRPFLSFSLTYTLKSPYIESNWDDY